MEELQHGECCCCLDKGDHRELSKQYYLDKRPEIYEVLFKDTFGIVLKYPVNKLICDCCIVKLREATYFRSMVETSQQRLGECITFKSECVDVSYQRLELIKEEHIKCEYECDVDIEGHDEQKTDTPNNDMQTAHHQHKEVKDLVGNERLKMMTEIKCEYESDVDIEGLDEQESGTPDIDMQMADYQHKEVKVLDLTTSSSHKLPLTQPKLKPLKVKLGKSTMDEFLSYSSNSQYKNFKKPKKSYSCNICQFQTGIKCHLTEHMYKHTGEKPFSCNICQYKTARKRELKIHMNKHTGQMLFSCHICKYKTIWKRDLNKHKYKHTGETPFSCDICQYKTAWKCNLLQHMYKHIGKMEFSCNICQYKTIYKGRLDKHMYKHTDGKEMPFCCDNCKYKTAWKGRLVEHMRKHMRKIEFPCNVCQFKTIYKKCLIKHMYNKHNDGNAIVT